MGASSDDFVKRTIDHAAHRVHGRDESWIKRDTAIVAIIYVDYSLIGVGNHMKAEHRISFDKDEGTSTTGEIAATIAKLKEENEILRRLATLLSAQLNLTRGISAWEGQRPSR